MSIGPGSQSSLREANTFRVVETIKKYGQLTQVELTAATGLSQASISNIVKRLVTDGILEVQSTIRSGRRAQLVSLAHRSGLVAGIHVGRRGLSVAIADLALDVQERIGMPLPVNHRPDTTLDRAAMLVGELFDRMGAPTDAFLTVGVAMPAPIDPDSATVAVPGLLPGWDEIDVAQVLVRRLGRPVAVDNDANAALLAETRLGHLRGVSDGMILRASYTTGAGVMLNGELHRGLKGTAGELGHMQIDPAGLICLCGGRGCLNTFVGADVLVSSLRLTRGQLSLSDLVSLAIEGDPGCRQVIADAGAQIGSALADIAAVFAPTDIVVGGELARTHHLLLDPIRDSLQSRPLLAGTVAVHEAKLGADAELYGALVLALKEAETLDPAGGFVAPLADATRTGARL